jgi:hypothetical protein
MAGEIGASISLFCDEKFPARVCREFRHKHPSRQAFSAPGWSDSLLAIRISLQIPGYQGILDAETGSMPTASATTQFTVCEEFL